MPIKNDKILISPTQALILLISHTQEKINNLSIEVALSEKQPSLSDDQLTTIEQQKKSIKRQNKRLLKLKRLMLNGANHIENSREIHRYLKLSTEIPEFYENYEISLNPEIINNDPVRRYFETHLAYETIIEKINDVDSQYLQNLYFAFKRPLDELSKINRTIDEDLDTFEQLSTKYNEYYTLIQLIQDFPIQSVEDIAVINKIQYLITDLPEFYKLILDESLSYLTKNICKLSFNKQKTTDTIASFLESRVSNISDLYRDSLLFELKEEIIPKIPREKKYLLTEILRRLSKYVEKKHKQRIKQFQNKTTLLLDTLTGREEEITNLKRHLSYFRDIPGNVPFISEYVDLRIKLHRGIIFSKEMSIENRRKLEKVAKYAFHVFLYSDTDIKLPIPIYGQGLFSKEFRGRERKNLIEQSFSYSLGILKDYMPLSNNDAARSESLSVYPRPINFNKYIRNTVWAEYNFSRGLHPFVNSISGSMLMHTRVIALLKPDNLEAGINELFTTISQSLSDRRSRLIDKEQILKSFTSINISENEIFKIWRILISLLLYASGGHSLFEFIEPFNAPEFRQEFIDFPKLQYINLTTMFYENNEDAFDKALEDSITYNSIILNKQKIHLELRDKNQFKTIEDLSETKSTQSINTTSNQSTTPIDEAPIDLERAHLVEVTNFIRQYIEKLSENAQINEEGHVHTTSKNSSILQEQSLFNQNEQLKHKDEGKDHSYFNKQIIIILENICDYLNNGELLQTQASLIKLNQIVTTKTHSFEELAELMDYLNCTIPVLVENPILASTLVRIKN